MSWSLSNRTPAGTKLRRLQKRLRGQWPRKGQIVMSPQWRSAHAPLAFLLIICETTAAPPRLQLIRRVHCRGHRFRYPSIGRNFHPDSVQTTSQSETCCTGFHLSNEILGRAFSRFVSGYHSFNMSHDGSAHRLRDGLRMRRTRCRKLWERSKSPAPRSIALTILSVMCW